MSLDGGACCEEKENTVYADTTTTVCVCVFFCAVVKKSKIEKVKNKKGLGIPKKIRQLENSFHNKLKAKKHQ